MVFSKLGGMFKKDGDDAAGAEMQRVFESHHLAADRGGGVLLVTVLCESVTDREAGIVFEETNQHLDNSCKGLIVDLSQVGVLTSAGIGTLVRLHKRLGERQGRFAVCSLSDDLSELFRLTRMDRLFTLAPDRDAAMRVVAA
ncbi:MAG: STAS domain-containing protein [Phycisphaeraceae bacterium]|nr:MAG: STAS domain-containing protein [Phycisphaeraceae bacterium]